MDARYKRAAADLFRRPGTPQSRQDDYSAALSLGARLGQSRNGLQISQAVITRAMQLCAQGRINPDHLQVIVNGVAQGLGGSEMTKDQARGLMQCVATAVQPANRHVALKAVSALAVALGSAHREAVLAQAWRQGQATGMDKSLLRAVVNQFKQGTGFEQTALLSVLLPARDGQAPAAVPRPASQPPQPDAPSRAAASKPQGAAPRQADPLASISRDLRAQLDVLMNHPTNAPDQGPAHAAAIAVGRAVANKPQLQAAIIQRALEASYGPAHHASGRDARLQLVLYGLTEGLRPQGVLASLTRARVDDASLPLAAKPLMDAVASHCKDRSRSLDALACFTGIAIALPKVTRAEYRSTPIAQSWDALEKSHHPGQEPNQPLTPVSRHFSNARSVLMRHMDRRGEFDRPAREVLMAYVNPVTTQALRETLQFGAEVLLAKPDAG